MRRFDGGIRELDRQVSRMDGLSLELNAVWYGEKRSVPASLDDTLVELVEKARRLVDEMDRFVTLCGDAFAGIPEEDEL